jgi:hypothetical protein
MASHILETLEKAEEVWRAGSPEWKRKIDKWEAWKARQKNKERVAQKAAARKRDPDDEMLQESEYRSWESYFDPEDPSPQFSFADTSAYAKEELLEDIRLLRWTSTASTLDLLFRALRRGIAVHHSGMNKTYRVLVERCFLSSSVLKIKGFNSLLDFFALASFESSSQQVRYHSDRGRGTIIH